MENFAIVASDVIQNEYKEVLMSSKNTDLIIKHQKGLTKKIGLPKLMTFGSKVKELKWDK